MNKILRRYNKIVICGLLFAIVLSISIATNFGLSHSNIVEAVEKTEPLVFEWMSHDEALKKAEKENKHILVFFYTDSCGWCDKMEREVYSNEEVKKMLAENYVSIKINAMSNNEIEVNGEKMTEKAFALRYQVTGYPTTWFLESKAEGIAPLPGYVTADQFITVLKYIGEDWYKTTTFQEYVEKNKS